MKGKGCKMNKGGKVHGDRAMEHAEEKEAGYNKGGVAKGHKAHGHKGKGHMAKRARGGRMTPSSPLSGAEPKGLPGAGKGVNRPVDKEMD